MVAKIVTQLLDKANRVDPGNIQGIASILWNCVCHIWHNTTPLLFERKLLVNRFIAGRSPDLGIIARQMAQRMKHIFWVGIDRVGDLFRGLPGASRELFAYLSLKLQQFRRRFIPSLHSWLIVGVY